MISMQMNRLANYVVLQHSTAQHLAPAAVRFGIKNPWNEAKKALLKEQVDAFLVGSETEVTLNCLQMNGQPREVTMTKQQDGSVQVGYYRRRSSEVVSRDELLAHLVKNYAPDPNVLNVLVVE